MDILIYMAKGNAGIIADYAEVLLELLNPNDEFPDWVEDHISVAASYVSQVKHALERMIDSGYLQEFQSERNPYSMQGDYMTYKNLHDLAEYGQKIDEMIEYGDRLPDWMQHKLAVARRHIGDVKHFITWFLHTYHPELMPQRNPKKNRCWKGYEPVPGKKPYSKGSCRKIKKR